MRKTHEQTKNFEARQLVEDDYNSHGYNAWEVAQENDAHKLNGTPGDLAKRSKKP